MGWVRLPDGPAPPWQCDDPLHSPPLKPVPPPGRWLYICLACGRTLTFDIRPEHQGPDTVVGG